MNPKKSPFILSLSVTKAKALSINRTQMNASIRSTAVIFKDVLYSWSLPRKIGGASPIWIARTLHSSGSLSVHLYVEMLTINYSSYSRRPPGIQLLVTGLGRDVSWQVRMASFQLLADGPNARRDPIHGRGCADGFLRIDFFTSWTERRTRILNGRTGSNHLSVYRGPLGPDYFPVGVPEDCGDIALARGSCTVEKKNRIAGRFKWNFWLGSITLNLFSSRRWGGSGDGVTTGFTRARGPGLS
jgi:hypothetical protein